MSWLSAINLATAILQNYNQYNVDKDANKFMSNMAGSAVRIGVAEDMYAHGNIFGHLANGLVPYTNTTANQWALGSLFTGGMYGGMGYGCGMGGGFYYGQPFVAPPPLPPMGGGNTTVKIWC